MAVGTNTGKVMICSAAGLLSVLDISPSGVSSAGPDPSTSSSAGSRAKSRSGGAVQASSGDSVASTPTRGRSSLLAPWQEGPADNSRGSQQAEVLYAVQALVQRGRGFIAAGSMGDVYLIDPAGGNKG